MECDCEVYVVANFGVLPFSCAIQVRVRTCHALQKAIDRQQKICMSTTNCIFLTRLKHAYKDIRLVH